MNDETGGSTVTRMQVAACLIGSGMIISPVGAGFHFWPELIFGLVVWAIGMALMVSAFLSR